jgi:hypothetical protein
MAKNRDLLKEAIADAKAVREMAIANAKSALEETFSPRIKEMFSAKLQEMENEEELEEAGFDGMKGNIPEAEEEMHEEELNLDELLAELEEDEEPLNESEDEEESDDEEEGEPLDLEDMTDEDLKQMIEDVISDMISSGELEAGESTEEEPEDMETEMEDEEVSIEELLREIEEDLDEEETIDEIGTAAGQSVSDWYMLAGPALLALSLGLGMAQNKVKSYLEKRKKEGAKPEEAIKDLRKKSDNVSEEYSEELEEAYSTIETLRTDLNEVNLLNAKLLYTNKIFKAKNLNESQKVKVLSSFDKASTVSEVKLVFETLNEGLKVKTPIKEHLGSASKSILPPKAKQPIVEENETFKRMQQLAFYKSEY